MKCRMCNQPIRIIPTNSKFKDTYNKVVTHLGKVCMPCALKYKVEIDKASEEADNLSEEERAVITEKRMRDYFKSKGMNDEQVEEAIKQTVEEVGKVETK